MALQPLDPDALPTIADHVFLSGPPRRSMCLYKTETWENVFDCDREEDRERYQPGGFHPVHLGDTLGTDRRYRILHKLGYGGFSTVWLARDEVANRYVALKIVTADASEGGDTCRELRTLKALRASTLNHPGRKYISIPFDHFRIQGPNGCHLCLSYPALGPQISRQEIVQSFGGELKRKMTGQVAQGLAFLHANGIGHGDLKPSNILLQLVDFESWTEQDVHDRLRIPLTDPVVSASGEDSGPTAPSYIVRLADMPILNRPFLSDQIMITDFGESFDVEAPPEGLGTPLVYCSPELLFDGIAGTASDVWALACTLYEIRVGSPLFELIDWDDDFIIRQWVGSLGRLPARWWQNWEARHGRFEDDGRPVINPVTGKAAAEIYELSQLLSDTPHATSPEEVQVCSDLLAKLLRYEPEERFSAAQALVHPWFNREFN
ncbi:MAG: hypothetical protein M1817_003079 [Caeruleum heppii]|nr:MAG: hypothetical protein M1817_003079 [Caeruleum heppii]